MTLSFRTKINAGFIPAFVLLAIVSYTAYHNTTVLVSNAESVNHTHEVLQTIEQTLSELKDLETGQRGFVITGSEDYLAPFNRSLGTIDATIDRLQALTGDNEKHFALVAQLRDLKNKKVDELHEAIQLRKEKGFSAALKFISLDHGKLIMRQMRGIANQMRNEEIAVLKKRDAKTAESTRFTLWIILIGGVLSLVIILGATVVVNLAENERVVALRSLESQNRIRTGLIRLSEKLTGEQSISKLAKNIVETLSDFVQAQVGAIYVADPSGTLKFAGGYGVLNEASMPLHFKTGEGLVGQAAELKAPIVLADPPDHYLKVKSSLGDASPKSLQVLPFVHEGQVKGVLEVGVLSSFSADDSEYLKLTMDIIAVAFNSAQSRAKVAELLEETQSQSEELQVQQEELKAANEELHLKTQELEAQQEELQQTNEELEEQRSALEEQTERLEINNREVIKARQEVEEKAAEVERASKYKSEFLANMSHELRTPLNSILLLSKSLAENSEENLSEDQQEVCRTVYSSGVDLLHLINDILDLSKVEAGKLDIKVGEADVAELASSMENQFRRQMDEKGLKLVVEVAKSCPRSIFTDRLRLEQIIKNFLSNSLKFTEKGKVVLSFDRPSKDIDLSGSALVASSSIAIAVTDTGIGIPDHKKSKIFEAFEQIDSTTSRKYGGAGLGLTIATKIARLLGGEIRLESDHGKGSRFVVILPERLESVDSGAHNVDLSPHKVPLPAVSMGSSERIRTGAHGIEDDRKNILPRDRVILIIEDDPSFAKILQTYCHQHDFKCLLAGDGEDGLSDAMEFTPSAVLLDLRLPGLGGISVLSSLKRNAKTRHIPVHVISIDEKSADVLKMGAIGYLNKPVRKEDIENAFRKIEDKLKTTTRKVLVVEDRKVERDNILRLIANDDVETTGVETAQDALKELKKNMFDCIVLDLKLPDMSGFELLEAIEKDVSIVRPPVIVYTGRDLTKDEIDRLGRFSQSIIIKGVRSEERLLDELTLFLHHVESELPAEKRKILERVRHREEIFEGKKLLVVDDDMRNVFALRNVFSKKGFEVIVAKTGIEALNKIAEIPDIDLVLMDIMMPEMDGYEAIQHIRADKKHDKLPIIALTAKAMAADRDRCLEAGANDYLPKPIDVDHLMALLRVWLSR